jgi:hypothetical protein
VGLSVRRTYWPAPPTVLLDGWSCLRGATSASNRVAPELMQLANRPHWIERVQCNETCLNVIALGAFEQPAFETNWPW